MYQNILRVSLFYMLIVSCSFGFEDKTISNFNLNGDCRKPIDIKTKVKNIEVVCLMNALYLTDHIRRLAITYNPKTKEPYFCSIVSKRKKEILEDSCNYTLSIYYKYK